MPVNSCSSGDKPGFKWGDSGKCYTYTPNNEKSMGEAKRKATIQGIAIGEYKPSTKFEKEIEQIVKGLKDWFREEWVDLSRPKAGGGFEPCGRPDADKGKYPKCVPAARAARMSEEEIASAVRRKRRAESTQRREDKKPIYVSTEKTESVNVPTNPRLYARVKAEAKRRFDVYPSAYANAWLVREYKRRGGGYKTMAKDNVLKNYSDYLTEDEAMLAHALESIAQRYGKFDEDGNGIWAGYESAEENDDKDIGVHCMNCVLYEGNGVCKIIAGQVEDFGKCRFAVIPDGLVQPENEEDEMEDEGEEMSLSELISLFKEVILNRRKNEE